MYPLSDKDLDRMSREAAEQYSAEPQASGWDQLESRLEKELPAQKDDKKRRVLWLFLLLFITCGSGLFWLLEADHNSDSTGIAATIPASPENNPTPAPEQKGTENTVPAKDNSEAPLQKAENLNTEPAAKTSKQDHNITANSKSTVVPAPAKNQDVQGTFKESVSNSNSNKLQNKTAGGVKQSKRNSTLSSMSARIGGADNELVSMKSKKKGSTKKLTPVTASNNSSDLAAPVAATSKPANADAASTVTAPSTTVSNAETAAVPASAKTPVVKDTAAAVSHDASVVTNTTNNSKIKKPSKNNVPERGFSFGVVAGFDYSRIHAVGDNTPGYDAGIQIAYKLNKRWSFNTGLILTKKNYTAAGSDFHPPKHYWTTYIKLDEVEGNCKMLDIPLNIRYNLTTTKNKWFVSTGLSSYIMTNQDYSYYYTVNNTPRAKDWSMNSQTNYWLSIVNISGGVEKKLNRTLTLQAEPFIKIPLKGVGFGNMNINSYGLMTVLKFHPVFKH